MSAHALFSTGSAPPGVTPPTEQSGRGGFLSDVIVDLGFADRATVEQAVRAARSPGTTVARVLVERGDITEDQLAHATAERHGLAYVDLDAYEVEPAAANLLGPAASRRYQAVGISCAEGTVLVAMADPADPLSIKDISELTGMSVVPAVAPAPAILALVDLLPLPDTERGPVARAHRGGSRGGTARPHAGAGQAERAGGGALAPRGHGRRAGGPGRPDGGARARGGIPARPARRRRGRARARR